MHRAGEFPGRQGHDPTDRIGPTQKPAQGEIGIG
jgi:hypothetical protein